MKTSIVAAAIALTVAAGTAQAAMSGGTSTFEFNATAKEMCGMEVKEATGDITFNGKGDDTAAAVFRIVGNNTTNTEFTVTKTDTKRGDNVVWHGSDLSLLAEYTHTGGSSIDKLYNGSSTNTKVAAVKPNTDIKLFAYFVNPENTYDPISYTAEQTITATCN
ncbi:hypothetical protein [Endozoicomonas sp. ALB032]|uniref:hypothetical protein n=1 Tax=Endozoicomonas sp. ALB032 TaxID=3403082 RepID=UPI003BB72035